MNFRISLSISAKKIPTGILTRIALNLLINCGRCEILTILSLLAFEQTISDYVGNYFLSKMFYLYMSFTYFVQFIPKAFHYYGTVNDIFTLISYCSMSV